MHIYGLVDPKNQELRYIGFTSQTLKARLRGHVKRSALKDMTYKNNWIKSLLDVGLKPEIFEIQTTDDLHWAEDEQWNIAYFKMIGCRLTNDPRCPGGELPPSFAGKIPWNKGRKMPPHVGPLISKAHMGHKYNLGKVHSKEHNSKISASGKSLHRHVTTEHKYILGITKRKLNDKQVVEFFDMLKSGCSTGEIRKHFNIGKTVYHRVKHGLYKTLGIQGSISQYQEPNHTL